MRECIVCHETKALDLFTPDPRYRDGRSTRCLSCRDAKQKAYRDANREKIVERGRVWRAEHPERQRETNRRANTNQSRELKRAQKMARRARLSGSVGRYTKEEWLALCEKYGNVCLCCKRAEPLTVDHVIPLSRGGSNTIDNLQPLCISCNQAKRTRTLDFRPSSVAV